MSGPSALLVLAAALAALALGVAPVAPGTGWALMLAACVAAGAALGAIVASPLH